MKKKTYLGDGVYVELVDDIVEISTHNGFNNTNLIYFDSVTLKNFVQWLQNVENEKLEDNRNAGNS